MKRILLALVLITATVVAFAQQAYQSLALQSALPVSDVKMKDVVNGKEISLSEASQQNGLLVMFSCNTCPYVIRNQERTKEICTYAKQNNIGVIIINSNEAQRSSADAETAMQEYAQTQGYESYVVDKNSSVANAFGATRTPEVFLFDKNNTLIYKGAIDDNPSKAEAVQHTYLKDAIDATVAGKDITVKESKSVGCSIKRTATM